MVGFVDVGDRRIGSGQPCFVVAEAGVNHNGSLSTAFRLIDKAAESNVDAVKFQTFKAERLVSPQAPKAAYQIANSDSTESQLDMLRRLELPADAYRTLMDYCAAKGILFMSTPFDEESADLLDSAGMAVFKVASGEITNIPLLSHIAGKGKPMIISTGMASLAEVASALTVIRDSGNQSVVLLHCVSNYPADPADANLLSMRTMATTFGLPVGLSDHTPGVEVSLAAVALGACVVEKHFTLSKELPGPDHRASLEPRELANLANGIRTVESALGHSAKEPSPSEADTARVVRKSIVAAQDISAGTVLQEHLIAVKRPGTGLPPSMITTLVGRVVAKDIPANTLLTLEMLG